MLPTVRPLTSRFSHRLPFGSDAACCQITGHSVNLPGTPADVTVFLMVDLLGPVFPQQINLPSI